MKKWVFSFLISIFLLANFNPLFAQEKVEVNFFTSPTCPHCAKAKVFLENLVKKHPQIEIREFSFSENVELLKEFYQNHKVPPETQGYVPITFINEDYFLGFDEKISQDIENHILGLAEEKPITKSTEEREISLPILGQINLSNFSLPALAVILGFFDGFNVCSLGALILILGLVLAFRSKRKILIFGGIFILTTALVYGALIFLWHQLFSSLSLYLRKMEIIIGILALAGGGYFLKEFIKIRKRGLTCSFAGISQKMSQKIQKILKKRVHIFASILATFLFASVITLVEFPCSAVLPVLFAGILTKANLSLSVSLAYIILFLLFYTLDEIIVFLVSFFTLKIWIVSPKFITFLNLAAALLLFLLGFYYLFGLV